MRLMLCNWGLGALFGFAMAGLFVASNVAGLRELILNATPMWLPLFALFVGFGSTFGGVVCATAVMLLQVDDKVDGDNGRKSPILLPVFAFARARGSI
ncbi:MAG: hypothetical protein KGQ37_09305 [Hyphomicrobiales bacterium]|nr:hypothetical protein [Hyphomicrobiales bacterium]